MPSLPVSRVQSAPTLPQALKGTALGASLLAALGKGDVAFVDLSQPDPASKNKNTSNRSPR